MTPDQPEILHEITGILVTRNRPDELLDQICRIFENDGPIFSILIMDASPKNTFVTFNKNKMITYYHMPDSSFSDRITYALSQVTSEFSMLLADDDVYNRKLIKRCVSFLKNNSEYVAAHGTSFYRHVFNEAYTYALGQYSPSIEANSCSARLKQHSRYYGHTIYSVCRTQAFKTSFDGMQDFEINECIIMLELIQSFRLCYLGKIKRFSVPGYIKNPHYTNNNWLMPDKWKSSNEMAYDKLVDTASRRPPFSTDKNEHELVEAMDRFNHRDNFRKDHEYLLYYFHRFCMDSSFIIKLNWSCGVPCVKHITHFLNFLLKVSTIKFLKIKEHSW